MSDQRWSSLRPDQAGQPSLLQVLGRYWWLVALVLIGFLGLAFAFDATQPVTYEATAKLIVEDSRASSRFEVTDLGRPSTQASERYLADQVEIVRSAEVANAASEQLAGQFGSRRILDNTSVSGRLTSNLIEVTFTAGTAEEARIGADAVANAYQEVRRRQVQDTAAVALAKVDALLLGIDSDLEGIDRRIEAERDGDDTLKELNRQFSEAQAELNQMRMLRDTLPIDGDERLAINGLIGELLQDFTTWEVVLRISERGPELGTLIAEQNAALAEKATLVARANSITIDAELAAGGVTLFSPAPLPAEPEGPPLELVVALALALGLALSVTMAYYLTLRRDVAAD